MVGEEVYQVGWALVEDQSAVDRRLVGEGLELKIENPGVDRCTSL